jgi:hypothetical protein
MTGSLAFRRRLRFLLQLLTFAGPDQYRDKPACRCLCHRGAGILHVRPCCDRSS